MTLYQRIAAAGIPHANHESDLYVPYTDQVLGMIRECEFWIPDKIERHVFFNQVEQAPWVEIPLAYDPWWNERIKRP